MNLLALTVLMTTPQADAWEVLTNDAGMELRWHTMPITYRINPSNGQGLSELAVTTAIEDAIGEWEAVDDAYITFDNLGTTSQYGTEYGDDNLIYFEEDWAYDRDLLALTANWSDSSTGQILGFDIRINSEDHLWTVSEEPDRDDIQNMITHELGHALGLDHTEVDTTATMYGSAVSGETTKRELKWDDQAGANYLYGDGDLTSGPFACSASGASGAPAWLALLALAGVTLRRRDQT